MFYFRTMELTSVIYEKRGNTAHITLNRPDVFNAFDETQSYDLQAALKEAGKDAEVRVVVLTGAKSILQWPRFKSHCGFQKQVVE